MKRSRKQDNKTNNGSTTESEIVSKIKPQQTDQTSAELVLLGVIVVSFLSVPICYFLSYLPQMKDSLNVFLYSVGICASIAPLTYFVLIRHLFHIKRELYFYVFTLFAFTAIADLLLALTIDEYSSAFHFYLEQGEVYLKTAHGLFINYWDGSTHYSLYLIMLYCMLTNRTHGKFYRYVSLFWCGSIINSLIVLLGGAASGRYGAHIKPSYFLNVPYALFPVLFAIKQMRSRDQFIKDQMKKRKVANRPKSLLFQILDFIFIAYFVFAIIFALFRLLHVLQTPMMKNSDYYKYEPYMLNTSGFPLVQLLTYAFYFIPYYCSGIQSLLFYNHQNSVYRWFPDWTVMHAGAAAQAQFSYFASSLRNPTIYPDPSWSRIPDEHWNVTVFLNILLAIMPQLLAIRVCMNNNDQAFF